MKIENIDIQEIGDAREILTFGEGINQPLLFNRFLSSQYGFACKGVGDERTIFPMNKGARRR